MDGFKFLDLESDRIGPVAIIAKESTGKRPAPSTIWRWVRKGVKGARLEAVQHGGCWHTSPRAFAAFLKAQTDAALAPKSDDQAAAIDDALAREGLL